MWTQCAVLSNKTLSLSNMICMSIDTVSLFQVVGQKRTSEGGNAVGQYLSQDQSLQYYDANKRPRY